MKSIWKFTLNNARTIIDAPIERFLTVDRQGDNICVWAVVDKDKECKSYTIEIIGTGWELQDIDSSKYIGTLQEDGLVWHFFWDNIMKQEEEENATCKQQC